MKVIYLTKKLALVNTDTDAVVLFGSCGRLKQRCSVCAYYNNCAILSKYSLRVLLK